MLKMPKMHPVASVRAVVELSRNENVRQTNEIVLILANGVKYQTLAREVPDLENEVRDGALNSGSSVWATQNLNVAIEKKKEKKNKKIVILQELN